MTAKRILFGLLRPTLGGHSRTAVALAGVLRDRGHTIDFVVSAAADSGRAGSSGVTASLIHAAGFPVIPIEGETPRRDGDLLVETSVILSVETHTTPFIGSSQTPSGTPLWQLPQKIARSYGRSRLVACPRAIAV